MEDVRLRLRRDRSTTRTPDGADTGTTTGAALRPAAATDDDAVLVRTTQGANSATGDGMIETMRSRETDSVIGEEGRSTGPGPGIGRGRTGIANARPRRGPDLPRTTMTFLLRATLPARLEEVPRLARVTAHDEAAAAVAPRIDPLNQRDTATIPNHPHEQHHTKAVEKEKRARRAKRRRKMLWQP